MSVRVISKSENQVEVNLKFDLSGSMMEIERQIQSVLNEAGQVASQQALEKHDTTGKAIEVGSTKFFSKGPVPKAYQTPYGEVVVARHVYQTSKGGKTFCPLDFNARIIDTTTPFFAKQISSKFSEQAAASVMRDLSENHGRHVSKGYVQKLGEAVGAIAEATEETWKYTLPEFDKEVKSIAVGLDGTMINTVDDGWREAMVGTVSYFDEEGERLHTTYISATPEYGKEKFLTRLDQEISHTKEQFKEDVTYTGIADGAAANWKFLESRTEVQVLDFFHASEYLSAAAEAHFGSKRALEKREWKEAIFHDLKHKPRGASTALKKLKEISEITKNSKKKEIIEKSVTYFENQKHRMKYSKEVENNRPIGSGVTEAACKHIVKARLGGSGMRWKEKGAATVLALRCKHQTPGQWDQFWGKIDAQGTQAA